MKKNDEQNTNANTKTSEMFAYLKAMTHNEKQIERLQKKIDSIKKSNAEIAEKFKKLIND